MSLDLCGYDQVLAITQAAFNSQLEKLHEWDLIPTEAVAELGTSRLEGSIACPKMEFCKPQQESSAAYENYPSLTIRFESGNYSPGTGQSFPLKDVALSFKVKLVQEQKSKKGIADAPYLSTGVKEHMASIDEEDFDIEQIYLHVEESICKANCWRLLNINHIEQLDTLIQLVAEVFREESYHAGRFHFGFLPTPKNQQAENVIRPTSLRYSLSAHTNPDLNTFNYLMMTQGRKAPDDLPEFDFPLVDDPALPGRYFFAGNALMDDFVTPLFSELGGMPLVKSDEKPNYFTAKKSLPSLRISGNTFSHRLEIWPHPDAEAGITDQKEDGLKIYYDGNVRCESEVVFMDPMPHRAEKMIRRPKIDFQAYRLFQFRLKVNTLALTADGPIRNNRIINERRNIYHWNDLRAFKSFQSNDMPKVSQFFHDYNSERYFKGIMQGDPEKETTIDHLSLPLQDMFFFSNLKLFQQKGLLLKVDLHYKD